MNELVIESTYSTPFVHFNNKTGVLKIEGRSIPENPSIFYDPLVNWLTELIKDSKDTIIRLDVKLDYINSGSTKSILTMLRLLKQLYDEGADCQVNWHYEEDDESIRDLGKHYKNVLRMPFNLIELYS